MRKYDEMHQFYHHELDSSKALTHRNRVIFEGGPELITELEEGQQQGQKNEDLEEEPPAQGNQNKMYLC